MVRGELEMRMILSADDRMTLANSIGYATLIVDKGVVEVEVDAMVVKLEDSSRILDLEVPVEGGVGVDANVVGDVGCTPTKKCSDIVALAPLTVGMVSSSWKEVETYYKAYARKVNGKRCVTDSQIEEDSGVKTSKKCEFPVQIYASVNAENEMNGSRSKSHFDVSAYGLFPYVCLRLSIYVHELKFLRLFQERGMCVPACTKHLFWAGMKTIQCVKSIHSFFDDYVNKHTTLAEFMEMYNRAMEKRAETERQYDALSETFIRQIACRFPCESVFQHCYTDMKFKEIQRECNRIIFLHCFQNVVTSGNVTEYTFVDRVWCRNKETKKELSIRGIIGFVLTCQPSWQNVRDRYILRRWRKDVSRKDVSRKHTRVKVAYHDPSKTKQVVSYDEMQVASEPICSKAFIFKDTKHLFLEFLELLDIRVDDKRVMIESEMLNQTPSSICLKDKQVRTPASTTAKRKADCGIPTPESDKPPSSAGNEGNVKDPPRKAKPAHR
ncbi:Protein FAR-RED ELONGATED HYPOCOTYL 3 [Bienertia sinuspersici]